MSIIASVTSMGNVDLPMVYSMMFRQRETNKFVQLYELLVTMKQLTDAHLDEDTGNERRYATPPFVPCTSFARALRATQGVVTRITLTRRYCAKLSRLSVISDEFQSELLQSLSRASEFGYNRRPYIGDSHCGDTACARSSISCASIIVTPSAREVFPQFIQDVSGLETLGRLC